LSPESKEAAMQEVFNRYAKFRRELFIRSFVETAVLLPIGSFYVWEALRFAGSPLLLAGHALTGAGFLWFLLCAHRARLRHPTPSGSLSPRELSEMELGRVESQIELITRHIRWPLAGMCVGAALMLIGLRQDLLYWDFFLCVEVLVLLVAWISYRACLSVSRQQFEPMRDELLEIAKG
jgi:hypothetical protein